MTSAWKPIPRPRGPVSSSDPVRLTIETRWSGPRRSVFRLPEADHVPAKARDSPGASATSGSRAGPEHALQRTRAAGASHHGALASLERHGRIPWPDPPATMLRIARISARLISPRSCQSALGRSTRPTLWWPIGSHASRLAPWRDGDRPQVAQAAHAPRRAARAAAAREAMDDVGVETGAEHESEASRTRGGRGRAEVPPPRATGHERAGERERIGWEARAGGRTGSRCRAPSPPAGRRRPAR